MAIICDLETVPQAQERLLAQMPEDLRNPVMPDELENPEEPVWTEKVPKYASTKDPEERERLKDAWITGNRSKWLAKQAAAAEKWKLAAFEARSKFIRDAALDARLAHAKIIAARDTHTDMMRVFVWEPDAGQMGKIRDWKAQLRGTFRERPISIMAWRDEAEMLRAWFAFFEESMNPGAGSIEEVPAGAQRQHRAPERCISYYGNSFDFPFLYRRAWICGIPQRPLFMRGKYFDEVRMVDLDECWKMGDRTENCGGLDRLSHVLGGKPKTGDGANFWRWYEADPVEGLCYCMGDVDQTEEVARRMGVL